MIIQENTILMQQLIETLSEEWVWITPNNTESSSKSSCAASWRKNPKQLLQSDGAVGWMKNIRCITVANARSVARSKHQMEVLSQTGSCAAGRTLLFSFFSCALVIRPASDRVQRDPCGLLMLNETSAHYNTSRGRKGEGEHVTEILLDWIKWV